MEGTSPSDLVGGYVMRILSQHPDYLPYTPSSPSDSSLHANGRDWFGEGTAEDVFPVRDPKMDFKTLDGRLAIARCEARSRVESLHLTWDARRDQMQRSHTQQKTLYAEATAKERELTSRARVTPMRDDRLLVVTSLDDAENWKQTTYYPTRRYEISNVSYSRSQRRRDAVAGRTPASRGMQVSQTSRRSFGATSDVNYLAVSTPLQSRRGEGLSTRFSNPLEGTPSSSFKAHLPVPAGSPESTEYLGSWTGSSPHYTCKEEASDTAPSTALETATHDDASSRRRTVISTSRRPPEGAVEPLIFPRHRPGGMPMHSNPLLATRLRVAQAEDARHKQRTGRKPKDGRRRDGSKTERARRKPGWGGHDMASWARVCDVVPISPRRPVAGVAREPSVTLELPQRDPEYIPVVKTGGGEGSGFRLRHMGPWKGGVTRDRDSLCAPAKKAVWIGNLTERSPPRGVPFPGFAGERVVGVFGGDAVATRRVDALQLSHRVVVGGRRGPGEACWVAPSARRAPPVANMQPTLRGGLAVFDWARAQRWGLRACGLAAHAIGGGVVEGGVAAGGPRSRVAYDSRAGVQSGSGFMGQAGGASTPVQVHGGTGGSSAAPSSCWEGR